MEEFHNDPALRRLLSGEARRERNRVLRKGFSWLSARAAALFKPRHPARWIERLG